MFICETYLKKHDLLNADINQLCDGWEGTFINVTNFEGVEKIRKELDFDYLEGAIYLKYFDKILLDFSFWDLVDQLWSYILDMIEEFHMNGSAETFFPDQPIQITFENISNEQMLVSILGTKRNKWIVPKLDFLKKLVSSAEIFFIIVMKLAPTANFYDSEIEKIKKLKMVLDMQPF